MFLLTIESVVLLKANKRGKVLCLLLIIIWGGGGMGKRAECPTGKLFIMLEKL